MKSIEKNAKKYDGVIITVVETQDMLTSSSDVETGKIPFLTEKTNSNYNL